MEEMFELILAAIAIAVGVAAKNSKKKTEKVKARRDAAPDAADGFDWDQIERPEEKPAAGQLEMQIPYAPAEPAAKSAPAMAQPDLAAAIKAAINAVSQKDISKLQPARAAAAHPEGCHSNEGPAPGHHPQKAQSKPAAAQHVRRAEAPKPDLAKPISRPQYAAAAPGRVTAAQLRRAVVMSEVLGKPAALRRGIQRR